jgi:thioredoxin-dependent peroxiredoxin
MLRIVLLGIAVLVIIVLVVVLFVPRLRSRSKAPPVGSVAPEFTLLSQDGSEVSLKDYRGNWVVLYFYARDQTPG